MTHGPSIYPAGGWIVLNAPNHPDLHTAAAALGGRMLIDPTTDRNPDTLIWRFLPEREQEVRALATWLWGTDGTPPVATVNVAYPIPDPDRSKQDLWRFGRRLAHRPAHNAEVVLGDGVSVIAGRFPDYGGTRARPAINHNSGTTLEVRDVPDRHPDLLASGVREISGEGPPAADAGTPMLLGLDSPDRLGEYAQALLALEARTMPNPPPSWLLPFADASHRRAVTAVAVALFRAGMESAQSWADGWDAAIGAVDGALDSLRTAPTTPADGASV